MPWNKPQRLWHWLALLSPGAVSVAMTAFGKFFLARQDEAAPGIIGLPVCFILCLVIAFVLARGAGSAGRAIGLAIVFAVALLIVNFSIALAGCAFINPHFNMQ